MIDRLIHYIKLLVLFTLIWVGLWFFNNYGCRRVDGREMEPALPAEKMVTIDPNVRNTDQLGRDDFIAYSFVIGSSGSKNIIGRVIGLPGDRVRIENGDVYLNGEKLAASYVSEKGKGQENYAEIIVPRDTVFVLCDNRMNAKLMDSRALGPIGTWAIAGKLR